jgi:hypothetical protein
MHPFAMIKTLSVAAFFAMPVIGRNIHWPKTKSNSTIIKGNPIYINELHPLFQPIDHPTFTEASFDPVTIITTIITNGLHSTTSLSVEENIFATNGPRLIPMPVFSTIGNAVGDTASQTSSHACETMTVMATPEKFIDGAHISTPISASRRVKSTQI